MDSCEKYQELISRMLDDELDENKKAALEAHMDSCAECRRLYSAFASVSSALSTDLEEAPADMKKSIMSSVARRPKKIVSIRRWGGTLAAAACLALIILGASKTGLLSGFSSTAGNPETVYQTSPVSDSEKADRSVDDEYMTSARTDSADSSTAAGSANAPASGKTAAPQPQTADVSFSGPDGTFAVTDKAALSRLDALLAVPGGDNAQPGKASLDLQNSAEASPETYTVTYPDGKTVTVRTVGDTIVCTHADTGEEYTAAGSAEDFLALASELAGK